MTDIELKPGTKVRERDKRQVMTVKGQAGLGAVAHRFGSSKVNLAHKVVCEWLTSKGAPRSKGFLVSALEVVADSGANANQEVAPPAVGTNRPLCKAGG
ncbi:MULTISPECIES: hypothetical protein [Paraburkholderia]|uniref:hypothetical protein n=1 Tax=Paraburkholderia TaxID=1822464 RepID=UPI0012EB8FA3|nr:hypothetical protein [Paraburkholderia ferrariae]